MKPAQHIRLSSTLAICLAVTVLSAQQQKKDRAEFPYLIRIQQATQNMNGMDSMCTLIKVNGDFQVERSFQGFSDSKPSIRVFEGNLVEADLAPLRQILDDKRFIEIKSEPFRSSMIHEMDLLSVSVYRLDRIQNFSFTNSAARADYRDVLKPFEKWLKDFKKRKMQENRSAVPHFCLPPGMVQ